MLAYSLARLRRFQTGLPVRQAACCMLLLLPPIALRPGRSQEDVVRTNEVTKERRQKKKGKESTTMGNRGPSSLLVCGCREGGWIGTTVSPPPPRTALLPSDDPAAVNWWIVVDVDHSHGRHRHRDSPYPTNVGTQPHASVLISTTAYITVQRPIERDTLRHHRLQTELPTRKHPHFTWRLLDTLDTENNYSIQQL